MLSYLDFAEKLGILTPNYTTPYIATFIDLEKSGPMVIEIPPGLMAGMILDGWQRVLADLGVVGPDQGKGGKYLVLPPGHEAVAPEGYLCRALSKPRGSWRRPAPWRRQRKGHR